jgi:5'-nucleotidase (lipoprotein e(P4) family)
MHPVLPLIAVLALLGTAGCATSPSTSAPPPPAVTPTLPDSVHWFRDSAEQKAIYLEVYRQAAEAAQKLSAGLGPGSWGVILDIDETILDNSEEQKRQALSGHGFDPKAWNAWVMERRAMALPGAKGFIDTVRDELHGRVVLVTNRKQNQCPATEDNLHAVALHYDRILCDSVGDGNKNARFQAVIRGEPGVSDALNVLIWVGDNIQDFPTLTQRNAGDLSLFGNHYFALPNPMYGSWEKVQAH